MPRQLFVLAALVALVSCQDYRFEKINPQPVDIVNQQVTIHANLSPPSIMIVQDLSGSMCEPIQLNAPSSGQSCLATSASGGACETGYCSSCSPGCGTCTDPTDCGSKMQLVSTTMTSILNGLKPAPGQLNIGLASFGGGSDIGCTVGSIQVPIGDAVTTIPKIDAFYAAATPNGGTPTAATLQVAATDPGLTNPDPSARKFILLVTDGYPNCSEDAQVTACVTADWSNGQAYGCASPDYPGMPSGLTPPQGCACSFGSCTDPSSSSEDCCPPASSSGDPPAWYCLDNQGTDNELTSLYSTQSITTYVVGLGYDTAQDPSVLNGMAAAGSGNAGATAYQANSPATLQQALAGLLGGIRGGCNYTLDETPVNADLITVTLNGVQLQAGSPNGYTYTPPTSITINGSACAAIADGGTAENLEITAIAQ